MSIKALNIEIEGFGSIIKQIKYPLNNRGITILFGENGAGKSTIPNAIYWCLYGLMLKASKVPEPWVWIQDKEYQGTCVSFSYKKDGVKRVITRCLNYKGKIGKIKGGDKVFVYVGDKEIDTKYKKNIKQWIIKDIGYSPELFKNSVIFGQKLKRLMSESNETKKKLLEETFETTFIQKARDLVSEKLTKLVQDKNNSEYELMNCEDLIKSKSESIVMVSDMIKAEKKNKKVRLEEIKDQVKDVKKSIEGIQLVERDFSKRIRKQKKKLKSLVKPDKRIASELFKEQMHLSGVKQQIESHMNELSGIKEARKNTPRTCNKCGQKIPQAKVMEIIQGYHKREVEVNMIVDKLNKELSEIESTLRTLNSSFTQQELANTKRKEIHQKINSLRMERLSERKDIEALNKRLNDLGELYAKMDSNIATDQLNEKLKTLEEQLGVLKENLEDKKLQIKTFTKKIEIEKWLLNQPLANGGLKNFIFNTMLKKINIHLSQYQRFIKFRIRLSMDLDSTFKNLQIRVFDGDNEKPYDDLSGGQQQLIDVTLAMGLYDAITENKPFPFIFMDEIFESLTKKNIEVVQNIIEWKAQKTPIHLITHTDALFSGKSYEFKLNKRGQTEISGLTAAA